MASNTDDWSEISDPKTRKRVQNRLAQRNYRKNLKTRIEELERQLAEQTNSDGQRRLSNQPLYSPTSMISNEILPFSQTDYIMLGQVPYPGLEQQFGLSSLLSSPSSHSNGAAQPDVPVTASDEGEVNLKPGSADERRKGSEQSSEVPQHQNYGSDARDPEIAYDMEWDTNYISSDASISSHIESTQADARIPELLESDMESQSKTNNNKHVEPEGRQLPDNASLSERLEYVLEIIHRSGFDTLESVISKYYTSDFRPSPRLASSQHLSRNRRLPAILSDLRASAVSWTEWEAQGYKGEIVRSAESILAAERKKLVASSALQHAMGDLEKNDLKENGKEEGSESASIITVFQREAPHLWTLVSSLTTENGYTETQDDVQQALALMMILCCPGGTSRGKLYKLLKRYLGGE